MTAHTYHNDQLVSQYQPRQPRVTAVALSFALILAFILLFFSLPFLVSAGLWFLGMALVLIAYAFISYYRFAVPVWDTAIVGQAAGFIGIVLILLASLISI